MRLTSPAFLCFVFVTLIAYRAVPAKKQWWVLLAASVIFYLSFSVGGIFVMIGTALLVYFAGLGVQKQKDSYAVWLKENKDTADKETKKETKSVFQKKQKQIVAGTVAVTIGILFLCKYYGAFASGVNSLLNTNIWTAENILLPLGISYYSLQLLGYLVDVHRDIAPAEKNPLKVILYGGFFLSIMQGPFNRWNDLMPQLCAKERKKLSFAENRSAVLKIVGGYVKKLCIADQFAIISNEVFTNYTKYKGVGVVLGIVCFAVQLYADFSGYMDIIVGIGQLFGITMPENFRQPFFSRNMSEFWQRWHITLGLWLKDYVFYPILKSSLFKKLGKVIAGKIGKEASRRIPTYLGMLILWTVIGLWHGAGMHYVFGVGILQFLYIFLGEIFEPLFVRIKKSLRINENKLYWHVFQSLRCTALMMFAWVFFNASSVRVALQILKNMLRRPLLRHLLAVFSDRTVDGPARTLIYFALCIALLIVVDLLHEKGFSVREYVCKKPYPVRLAFYLILAFAIIIFGAYGRQFILKDFIYMDF
ncbi:MAG: MBOAT family protein [Clostridia bacterium]|nr:MBOAT family protein [Clostridia bacterium]